MPDWAAALRQRVGAFAAAHRLPPALAERWHGLAAADAEALADLAEALRLGENHLRDVLEWAEEIALRDGGGVADVLRRPAVVAALGRDLGRNEAVKAVREALRRLRFPRLVAAEERFERALRALRLPANVRLVAPPNLRDTELRLEIRAGDAESLRGVIDELRGRDFGEVFAAIGAREPT